MNRSLGLLIGTAVVLVGLVLIFANPFKDSIRGDNPEPVDLFNVADVEGATEIEIRAPGADAIVLSQESEGWVVATRGNFPADTTAVSSILRSLTQARSSRIVSTNPENRGKFQVDSTGVEVAVSRDARPVAQFVVGKAGQDFTTSYVRRAGENAVYVVRGINRQMFSRPQGMRDRTLLRFLTDSVSSVTAELPEEGWTLSRTDTAWVLTPQEGTPAQAQQPAVDQLLQTLSTLSADGFLDSEADTVETGLDSPDYRFTVRFLNGSESSIVLGKKSDRNQYYVARPDRDAIYLLGEWRLGNLAKKPEDLVETAGGE